MDSQSWQLRAVSVGAVTNIVMDYVLVVHVGMGIRGAAIATGIQSVPGFDIYRVYHSFLGKEGRFTGVKQRWTYRFTSVLFPSGLRILSPSCLPVRLFSVQSCNFKAYRR